MNTAAREAIRIAEAYLPNDLTRQEQLAKEIVTASTLCESEFGQEICRDDDQLDDYDNEPWYNALDDDDPCDHEDREINIVDGRAFCWRCGEAWHATAAEIQAQIDHEADYNDHMEREERRQWWRDRLWPLPGWWEAARSMFRRRKTAAPNVWASDDEIPF